MNIKEKILEKIDVEYERFFLDMSRTSKANIFACSEEIEKKKKIVELLQRNIQEIENGRLNQILTIDNIMEECYRYSIDHPKLSLEKCIQTQLEKI